MSFYHWRGEDLLLDVYVQPRASRDQIVGVHDAGLKIRITAPPVEGAANRHLCRFIGKLFGVPASRVSLVSGAGGRLKRVCVVRPEKAVEEVIDFQKNTWKSNIRIPVR